MDVTKMHGCTNDVHVLLNQNHFVKIKIFLAK
jgi:hypothetical protein